MEWIDTHAHLYDACYAQDVGQVMEASKLAGVTRVYLPNLTLETIPPMLKLVDAYPAVCRAMLGLHPCEIKKDYKVHLCELERWFSRHDFVAIGEVGIDLYWDKTFYVEQVRALHVFIDWALHHDLPLVLHVRNGLSDMVRILKDRQNGRLRGVFHCFSGDVAVAKQVVDLNFFLGIGGIVTFAKSHLPAVLEEVGLERLVLETDAPYLAPVPFRGKRNQPAYLVHIANKIAAIKGVGIEEVAAVTTRNAGHLFGG